MATPMDRCLSTVLVPPTQSCLWDTRMCESHDPGWWLEAFSNTGLRSSLTGETSANPNLAAETNLWCESSSLLPHLLGALVPRLAHNDTRRFLLRLFSAHGLSPSGSLVRSGHRSRSFVHNVNPVPGGIQLMIARRTKRKDTVAVPGALASLPLLSVAAVWLASSGKWWLPSL